MAMGCDRVLGRARRRPADLLPSLTEMAQRNPVAILPADAPVNVTARQMTETFNESGSENILLVVLTNDKGLTPADEGTYKNWSTGCAGTSMTS